MTDSRPRVLIVGGGIAGLAAARELRRRFRVTLADAKEYYEFTSGIFRAYANPPHWDNLTFQYKEVLERTWGVRFVWGEVTDVTVQDLATRDGADSLFAFVQTPFASGLDVVEFDYCLIANGCQWNPSAESGESPWVPVVHARARATSTNKHLDERFLEGRRRRILEEHNDLAELEQRAGSVLINGAGPLGVQWACELNHFFPNISIALVDFMPRCLGPLSDDAAQYCQEYMDRQGIVCKYNKKFADTPRFWHDMGMLRQADMVYILNGSKSCNYFMPKQTLSKKGPGNGNWILNNEFLQVISEGQTWGRDRIFAVGDCSMGCVPEYAATPEEYSIPPLPKQAYPAEEQAIHACRNIIALDAMTRGGQRCAPSALKSTWYPWGAGIFVISLGKSDGCAVTNATIHKRASGKLKYSGLVCAAQKELIESTKMAQFRGDHRLASLVWYLVHHWPINCWGSGPPIWCACCN